MYVVVVGAGRIGTRVVELARRDGHDVAVFDKDRERCHDISKRYDVIAYNVDATAKPTSLCISSRMCSTV